MLDWIQNLDKCNSHCTSEIVGWCSQFQMIWPYIWLISKHISLYKYIYKIKYIIIYKIIYNYIYICIYIYIWIDTNSEVFISLSLSRPALSARCHSLDFFGRSASGGPSICVPSQERPGLRGAGDRMVNDYTILWYIYIYINIYIYIYDVYSSIPQKLGKYGGASSNYHHPTTILERPILFGVPYRVQDHIEPRVRSKESIIY